MDGWMVGWWLGANEANFARHDPKHVKFDTGTHDTCAQMGVGCGEGSDERFTDY